MHLNKVGKPVQLQNNKQIQHKLSEGNGFNQIFQEQIQKNGELKFSKHAAERLEERNIKLSNIDISKINQAMDTAHKKGVKEMLILMDNRAFIANVKNKTVITAALEGQLKENIFTNIDGAVIL